MTWQPIFLEEFDALDSTKWFVFNDQSYSPGALGYYRPANVSVANSLLTITAKPENYGGRAYTQGQIETSKGPQQVLWQTPAGNWACETRVKIPTGKGVWPGTVWFMGASWNYAPPPGVNWPACGEIDNNEWYQLARNQMRFNVVNASGGWSAHTITLPFNIDEDFHRYRTEVLTDRINCIVDDILYKTVLASEIPNWVGTYDQPFTILCDLEIGGNGGTPDSTTQWPVQVVCDYIHVYQWVPDVTPLSPTGGHMILASQSTADDGQWNLEGTSKYAYGVPRWIRFQVVGPGDTLAVTVKNHPNPSAPGIPPSFQFQLALSLDGIGKGTLTLPCSLTPQTASIPVAIPAGVHDLLLVWPVGNDSYAAGVYDANLQLISLEVQVTGGTSSPTPPTVRDQARTFLTGLGANAPVVDYLAP